MPIDPHTGRRASTTDPATWGTLEEALAAVTRYRLTGIGFVFRAGGNLFGIDLDDCRNPETGELQPWAAAIVARFPVLYWEVSQSGTGLHGIGYGQLPPGRRRHDQIETYDASRFFVMTGNVLPGHETIGNCGDGLAAWHTETFPPQPEATTLPRDETFTAGDTAAIIDRLRGERSGKATRLLAGDTSGYPSPSEARAALAWKACYYTNDPEQVAGIVRSSDLFATGTPDRERDRKAARDAVEAVATYRGETWTPPTTARISTPEPPPTEQDRQPTGNRQDTGEGGSCTAELAAARARIASLEEIVAARERIIQRERERAADAEARAATAERNVSTLMRVVHNPELTDTQRMIWSKILVEASHKRSRGDVEPDGRVVLEPRYIANDHRPIPAKGERTLERNPLDQSKPLTRRANVIKIVQQAKAAGVLEGVEIRHTVKVTPEGHRAKYPMIYLLPPADPFTGLEQLATYHPADATPRKPYTRQESCSACGEIHPRVQHTYCTGCGAEAAPPRIIPVPIPPDDLESEPVAAHHDDRGTSTKNVRVDSAAASVVNGTKESTKNVRVASPPPVDAEAPDYWTPLPDRTYPGESRHQVIA